MNNGHFLIVSPLFISTSQPLIPGRHQTETSPLGHKDRDEKPFDGTTNGCIFILDESLFKPISFCFDFIVLSQV